MNEKSAWDQNVRGNSEAETGNYLPISNYWLSASLCFFIGFPDYKTHVSNLLSLKYISKDKLLNYYAGSSCDIYPPVLARENSDLSRTFHLI